MIKIHFKYEDEIQQNIYLWCDNCGEELEAEVEDNGVEIRVPPCPNCCDKEITNE